MKDDAIAYEVHTERAQEFAQFDEYTTRFSYPDTSRLTNKIVLIPLSYMYMNIPNPTNTFIGKESCIPQPKYYVNRWMYNCNNLYFPNAVVLLESFIKVILDHESNQTLREGKWQRHLKVWAMGYLYGNLNLRDDVLDSCESKGVKEFFNEQVKKANRGTDRTVIKRGLVRPFVTNDLIEDFQ
jgi:hypothetical protein